ncbi:tRNA wybutosine-synthesizing protein 3 [Fusarium culmorum]|uniref:tRNA(Phe) 7-[(3-amino-3-carboxypropyl)-4-demethylwyosine(37)-N(4)]-methyltransferase n=1 Tax=Fusarium culmorum TaxID=5516 RepID=A0A2T4GPT0_FUSCU|nr:tRNA wybutosine-synthesizing protein 3 [Fusarium culmorum]
MQELASCPPAFVERKKKILDQLAIPDTEYTDASPKGSVDEGIRDLIDEINQQSGFVTTSSCAGRVSVFLEGRRVAEAEGEDERVAGVGGKGAGGAWLFVSHDPIPDKGDGVTDWSSQFGLEDSTAAQNAAPTVKERRLVHFKFEAMVSWNCASLYKTRGNVRIQVHVKLRYYVDPPRPYSIPEHAQILLRCGLQAGFRESGALNIVPSGKDATTPMVAIRTMGLAFESLIGQQVDSQRQRIVSPEYLQTLVDIANERFDENKKRIERFQNAFREAVSAPAPRRNAEGQEWEDAAARRERKRAEGLRKKAELKAKQEANTNDENELSDREGEKQAGLLF